MPREVENCRIIAKIFYFRTDHNYNIVRRNLIILIDVSLYYIIYCIVILNDYQPLFVTIKDDMIIIINFKFIILQ